VADRVVLSSEGFGVLESKSRQKSARKTDRRSFVSVPLTTKNLKTDAKKRYQNNCPEKRSLDCFG
jgi:hypothetical protein